MTDDLYGITAAPPAEQRARAVAGFAGRIGFLVVALGTAVLSLSAFETRSWTAGFVLVVAGVLLAVGCLVHGARRQHERGRAFAVAAICVGLFVGGLAVWSGFLYEHPHVTRGT